MCGGDLICICFAKDAVFNMNCWQNERSMVNLMRTSPKFAHEIPVKLKRTVNLNAKMLYCYGLSAMIKVLLNSHTHFLTSFRIQLLVSEFSSHSFACTFAHKIVVAFSVKAIKWAFFRMNASNSIDHRCHRLFSPKQLIEYKQQRQRLTSTSITTVTSNTIEQKNG